MVNKSPLAFTVQEMQGVKTYSTLQRLFRTTSIIGIHYLLRKRGWCGSQETYNGKQLCSCSISSCSVLCPLQSSCKPARGTARKTVMLPCQSWEKRAHGLHHTAGKERIWLNPQGPSGTNSQVELTRKTVQEIIWPL